MEIKIQKEKLEFILEEVLQFLDYISLFKTKFLSKKFKEKVINSKLLSVLDLRNIKYESIF